jgi:hypothetical protein
MQTVLRWNDFRFQELREIEAKIAASAAEFLEAWRVHFGG